jgi:transcriptional regulator with XRE-family HTH domain
MNPETLKAWQAHLGLSDTAMSAYLGVPVPTFTKWQNGTRSPDAATRRLFAILQRIELDAPGMHIELIQDARAFAPGQPPARRGRPPKVTVPPEPENAPESPESADLAIPGWLKIAV